MLHGGGGRCWSWKEQAVWLCILVLLTIIVYYQML